MREKMLYENKENKQTIVLKEKDNSKSTEVKKGVYKLNFEYEYYLIVNSNTVWCGIFDKRLKSNIVNDCLVLELEHNLLLPLINIPISTLLKFKTQEQMNDYIKSKQEEIEKKEYEKMKEVYLLGISGELETNWRYAGYNNTKQLFIRIMDENSEEHNKFLRGLVDSLILYLSTIGKLVECSDKLKISPLELRTKLKKYPAVVKMLCIEYKIDIDYLVNFDMDTENKKSQKM